MIYDCILFSGLGSEDKILEIRIEELRPLKPIHVIVESYQTFTGKDKGLRLQKDRYNTNIRYITTASHFPDPWDNEQMQRNAIMHGLRNHDLHADDIIIISDVDEIPRLDAIMNYSPSFGLASIQMDEYFFWLNALYQRQTWNLPRIMPWSYAESRMPDQIRKEGFPMTVPNGGWHFSWAGGSANAMQKFQSFSHQEPEIQKWADLSKIQDCRLNTTHMFSGKPLEIMSIDEMPRFVRDNQEYFQELLYV